MGRRGPGDFGRGPGMGGRGPGGRQPPLMGPGMPPVSEEAPDEQEWSDIQDFMRENSPARLEAFQKFEKIAQEIRPDQPRPILGRIKQRLAVRYRTIKALELQQPEVAEIAIKQMRLEDQIFTLNRDLAENPDDKAKQDQLHDALKQYVENNFADRAARLAQLRKSLEREEGRLAQDRADIERIIERHADRFRDEFEMTTRHSPTTRSR
jgi:hypothetical protein